MFALLTLLTTCFQNIFKYFYDMIVPSFLDFKETTQYYLLKVSVISVTRNRKLVSMLYLSH